MADYDDTFDDKYSRGKVSCPSFNGAAKDWKSWLTKMRAYARVRGPVARDIIDLKKPPVERRQEFYDAFASDVGGWDELRKLDNPINIARYSRRVNQIIQEAELAGGAALSKAPAITKEAFVNVLVKRGLFDVNYEAYLARHPEERHPL